ncbi:hypothetical protein GCM10009835_05860 [Planosporangium flavigriseum]|uniref:Uncharacterized protein n=1 Tax=Planosporangium flavigriseum TaxID=373681 RepID=A0A8J3LJS3_9ACTN|nr:hypothetical protein Pfl04_14760 [Planosporangium flavigriseum]
MLRRNSQSRISTESTPAQEQTLAGNRMSRMMPLGARTNYRLDGKIIAGGGVAALPTEGAMR